MSTVQGGQGRIITDNLVLLLDVVNPRSYASGSLTWTDISGSGYNGTLNGGVTYSGESYGVFAFDGTDEFISFGTSTPNLYPRTNNYSWCGWLKFADFASNRQIWYGNAGGGNDGVGIFLDKSGGINRIAIEIFGTLNGRQFKYTTATPYLNKWTYWTFVLDNTTFTRTIYANGIQLSSDVILDWGNLRQEPSAGFNGLYIGSYNGTTWFYNGSIGSILVYNKALSTSEVLQNYNATRARFGV